MSQFKQILFATDLSRQTEKLNGYVKYFTTAFDAELHVVTVMEPPPDSAVVYHDMLDDSVLEAYEQEMERQIENSLRETINKYFSDLNIHGATLVGPIHKKIVDYAKDYKVDLIIMGTATKTGITEKIFGSNTMKVIAQAPCPVMTINPLKIREQEE